MRSDSRSSSAEARKRLTPSASASDADPPPTRAAIVAASASLVLLAPIELTKCWKRQRLRGVVMAARMRTMTTNSSCQRGCFSQVFGKYTIPSPNARTAWPRAVPGNNRRIASHRRRRAARDGIVRLGQQNEQHRVGTRRRRATAKLTTNRSEATMSATERPVMASPSIKPLKPETMPNMNQQRARIARVSTGCIASSMIMKQTRLNAIHAYVGPTMTPISRPTLSKFVLTSQRTGAMQKQNPVHPISTMPPVTRNRVLADARRAATSLAAFRPAASAVGGR